MNYMIDIETLGRRPNAIILEIGAVAFSDKIEDECIITFSLLDQLSTRSITPDTVDWWMQQKIKPNLQGNMDLYDGLMLLNGFITHCKTIWAKSPLFDLSILGDAYHQCGIRPPWKYYQTRDVRTLLWLYPVDVPSVGNEHNVLDDALYQTNQVLEALKCVK